MPSFWLIIFYSVHLGAIVAFAAMLLRPRLRDRFERRCIASVTAVDLAWIRLVACGALILYVLSEDLGSQADLGATWFAPPGYTSALGRSVFDWFLSDAIRLQLLKWSLVVVLAAAMAGVVTRVTVPMAAMLYFVFAALLRSFGKYFHEGYLAFYVLVVLACVPCGDALSWDARRRGETTRPASYAWAVFACWAAAVIPYMQLGISKLSSGGLFWFDGRSLRNYMLTDNLNLHEWNIDLAQRLIEAPTILFTIAGFVSLLIEASYVFVLVSPLLRRVLPACVALLHFGIWLGQDALFLDAILIPFIFYVPRRVRRIT